MKTWKKNESTSMHAPMPEHIPASIHGWPQAGQVLFSQPDQVEDRERSSAWETPLLRTTAMQRLRSISQLGFVCRVWPQATHSRFDHSLGCYHLAQYAVAHLHTSVPRPLFSSQQARTLLAAALLHDVGHHPFSHCLDGLRSLLPAHERVGRSLIEQGELATVLEREYHLNPAHVAGLIDPPETQEMVGSPALLRQLLTGPCDLDKLDYVARDVQACGFSARCADPFPLLAAYRIHWPEAHRAPRLAFATSVRETVRAWVLLRHLLYLHVYWHPVNRAFSVMLARAVQDALEADTLRAVDLQRADDQTLLVWLAMSVMPVGTRFLVQHLTTPDLYIPVCEIGPQEACWSERLHPLAQDASLRKGVERHLAHAFSVQLQREIANHEVLVDVLPPKRWELDGWFVHPQENLCDVACFPWSRLIGITPNDLARAECRHCPARILVAPHLANLFHGQEHALILSSLERVLLQTNALKR